MDTVYSVDGVTIHLTYERWFHIVENHDDLSGHYDDVLDTVENPDMILRGHRGSLIAVRGVGKNWYLAVIYRQLSEEDGFIITAYFTSKVNRKRAIWKKG